MLKLIKVRVMSVLMCLIVLASVLPTAIFAQTAANGISSEAEAHILSELRRARIPNAAIAVIQGGEVSYVLKDSTYDDLFQIGSIAKSFTGFGVLLLEDMGLLSVNDPVNKHLPWFEVRYNGVPVPHEDITIYNLLHHTSGFTSNERHFPRAAVTETTDEFIARMTGIELEFYPSTRYVYGNMNFIILGLIIEAVSGQSYDEFMTQHILHPLGMYNTFTDTRRAYETGRVVGGNVLSFFRPWPQARGENVHVTSMPTGGIFSGIEDMARWAGMHLGVVDVSEQFARVVQRSHEHNHSVATPFADMNFFYAAGWVVGTEVGGGIQHSGQVPGYSAAVMMFPQDNTAVVVLSNLRYISIERLGMVALDAAVNGSFNRAGFDMFAIVDTIATIYIAVGIFYAIMLARLALKLKKRLHSGEIIKVDAASISIKGLISPVFAIAGLIAYYTFPFFMDTNIASIRVNWPYSFTIVAVAIWVTVLYDLFSWWIAVFVKPQEKEGA